MAIEASIGGCWGLEVVVGQVAVVVPFDIAPILLAGVAQLVGTIVAAAILHPAIAVAAFLVPAIDVVAQLQPTATATFWLQSSSFPLPVVQLLLSILPLPTLPSVHQLLWMNWCWGLMVGEQLAGAHLATK